MIKKKDNFVSWEKGREKKGTAFVRESCWKADREEKKRGGVWSTNEDEKTAALQLIGGKEGRREGS